MTITHLKEETKVNNRDEVNSACIRGNMKLNVTFLTYIWKLFFQVFSDQSLVCRVVFPNG